MSFFGRPPFAPFARAAAVFASDVDLPPLRPSFTAAGFLRGTEHVQGFRAVHVGRVEAMSLQHGGDDAAQHVGQGASLNQRHFDGAVSGGADGGGQRHEAIKPNRLGFVKEAV